MGFYFNFGQKSSDIGICFQQIFQLKPNTTLLILKSFDEKKNLSTSEIESLKLAFRQSMEFRTFGKNM